MELSIRILMLCLPRSAVIAYKSAGDHLGELARLHVMEPAVAFCIRWTAQLVEGRVM